MADNDKVRKAAENRLKAQAAFWRMAGGFAILWVAMTVIWALSDGGSFWPAWVFFGTGLALCYTAWSAFGPRNQGPSQQKIDEEMRKFQGPDNGSN